MRRSPRALAAAALVLALGGCATSPVSIVPRSPAAPPSASPAVRWIGFGAIGELTVAMRARRIGDLLGATTREETGNPQCGGASYSGGATPSDAALARALVVLAASKGATGRVDVLRMDLRNPGTAAVRAALPRTAAGIGLGSTLAQLRAAYPGRLMEAQGADDARSVDATLLGPGTTAMVFHVDRRGAVQGISTGRLPEVQYAEGCG